MIKTMAELKVGQLGTVKAINANIGLKQRFMDMGIVEGTSVKCVLKSPAGDPMAYRIKGAVLAIRKEDAKKVLLKSESEAV